MYSCAKRLNKTQNHLGLHVFLRQMRRLCVGAFLKKSQNDLRQKKFVLKKKHNIGCDAS